MERVWFVAILVLACGCAPAWETVPTGEIQTEGVSIEASDGSFSLKTGERFRPPFFTRDCVVKASPENFELAREWGARSVKVHVPGRDKPLHGLLAFCKVHPEATGPATRLYQIQVPASSVEKTSGGRVYVVFEETNKGGEFDDGFHHFDAWQLWLSEVPFL